MLFERFSFCFSYLYLGSVNLRPTTFEGVYIIPVSSEASWGCILNTNQLHNIEQRMNINHNFFFCNEEKLHFLVSDGQQKKFSTITFLKYIYYKNFTEQIFFCKFAIGMEYQYGVIREWEIRICYHFCQILLAE